MSEPCFRCGAARSCKHRTVKPAQVLANPPKDSRSMVDVSQLFRSTLAPPQPSRGDRIERAPGAE